MFFLYKPQTRFVGAVKTIIRNCVFGQNYHQYEDISLLSLVSVYSEVLYC